MIAPARVRCAIYTRKSTDEGLDQEFNSLDAQREACAAFITSQIGLGWKLIDDRFDDGGISGGTMNGLPCNASCRQYAMAKSMWWWSTKSID